MSGLSDVRRLEVKVTQSSTAVADLADLDDAADVFGLLADPGRLRLLVVLLDGESSVGRLADSAQLSESSASHALRLLRAHRVVSARRDGRMVYYRLGDNHVRQLLQIALQHAQHSSLLHPGGE